MSEGVGRTIGNLRLVIVLVPLIAWTLLLAPFQWLFLRRCVLRAWPTGARVLPHLYHRVVAPLLGMRIETFGTMARERPLLLVANHISWADIVVLSAVAPVSFIAKAEMVTWPIFGWLARAQRTIFVDRADRKRASEQADRISRQLEAGDAMVLFPEGTTSDGMRVLPFNASLLGAAGNVLRRAKDGRTSVDAVYVQPVALHYARKQGMAVSRMTMRDIGWPGAVPLMPHLPDTIRDGALDVHVSFAEPIRFDATSNRKHVSRLAHEAIRDMRAVDLKSPRA